MSKQINVLIVEDSEDDAVLVVRELQHNSYDVMYEIVDTLKAMKEALDRQKWDVIICDYSLPKFSMLDALELLHKEERDIPFIIVSGSIVEEVAVKALKSGADDYIMKDRLARLAPSIERETQEVQKRQRIKEIEKQLHMLSRAVEQSPSIVLITDTNGNIEYVNAKFTHITGYSTAEITGQNINILQSNKHSPEFYKEIWDRLTSGKEWQGEICNRNKNGEIYWELASISPVENQEGIVTNFIKLAEDITERKEADEKIKASLREKEVLLKEIHHRVKNNMQVISSLLNLQSKNIKEKHLIDIFQESQNRVKSMALIHEELYHTKDLASIDFAHYVGTLTGRLMRSLSVNSDRILLRVIVDNVFLGVDTAIPCGLIINELFTNSLKYAFPAIISDTKHEIEENAQGEQSERKGEININFYSENNKYILLFNDNGVGLPEDLDFRKTKTLGLELVNTLTQQLEGTIELDRSKGTEFKITFEV